LYFSYTLFFECLGVVLGLQPVLCNKRAIGLEVTFCHYFLTKWQELACLQASSDDADRYMHIDDCHFRGKDVIVIDDITTGKTATAFIDRMVSAGANVRMAFFLAKTKYFKRYND